MSNNIHVDDNGYIILPLSTSFSELSSYLMSELQTGNEQPAGTLMSELGELSHDEQKDFVAEFIQNMDASSDTRVIDLMVKHKWLDSARATTEKDEIEVWLPIKFV